MTLQTFKRKFGTQEKCLDYLVPLRFPNGVCCRNEKCQEYAKRKKKNYKLNAQYKFRCGYCRGQYSVISLTLFQDTPYKMIPLWFRAIWYITSEKSGTSAFALQKFVGLGSYRTAWTWLYRLRRAMIPEQEKLKGTVIVDKFSIMVNDDYIPKNDYIEPDYLNLKEKFLVMIAVEYNEKKIGQIRMREIKLYDNDSAINADFINNSIKPFESTLVSNGHIDLTELSDEEYPVKIVEKNNSENYQPVCKVISQLEKWKLLGSLPCVSSDKHLSNYLNECCFKFNNRKNKEDWFFELLRSTVFPPPSPKEALIQEELEEAERLNLYGIWSK